MEQRDIFSYQLNLSEKERETLILHMWEIRNASFDYHFIDENCAYRMLTLLDVATTDSRGISSAFTDRAFPTDIIIELRKRGYIHSVSVKHSKESTLNQRIKALSKAEAKAFRGLTDPKTVIAEHQITTMLDKHLISLAIDYVGHLIAHNPSQRHALNKRKKDLLKLLQRLPTTDEDSPPDFTDTIETGVERNSELVYLKLSDRNQETILGVGYRYAYHDMLDYAYYAPKGTAIELGKIELEQRDGEVNLRELTLLDIESHAGARFLQGGTNSWRFRMGRERRLYDSSSETLVNRLSFAKGASVTHHNTRLYVLADVTLQHSNRNDDPFFVPRAAPEFGLIYQGGDLNYRLHLRREFNIESDAHAETEAAFSLQWHLERQWALRFNLSHNHNNKVELNTLSTRLSFFY